METSKATMALGALAQDTRLDAFRLLVQAGDAGLSAGHLAEKLGVPPSSLSHHLKELKFADLVTYHRQQRNLIYVANYATMNGVLDFLLEKCCGGRPEICDPRTKAQAG